METGENLKTKRPGKQNKILVLWYFWGRQAKNGRGSMKNRPGKNNSARG